MSMVRRPEGRPPDIPLSFEAAKRAPLVQLIDSPFVVGQDPNSERPAEAMP